MNHHTFIRASNWGKEGEENREAIKLIDQKID
jgi:hypothetical protein